MQKQRKSYHSDRNIVLGNWWKLQETNNCKYLSKKEGARDDYSAKSMLIYETIYNEYLQNGGLGDEEKYLMELKRQWVDSRSKWLLTGKASFKMDSKKLSVDIEAQKALLKDMIGTTKEEALGEMSKAVGYLSENDITLKGFQDFINNNKSKK